MEKSREVSPTDGRVLCLIARVIPTHPEAPNETANSNHANKPFRA